MQNAHHALELIEAPTAQVQDTVRHWLTHAGFKVTSAPSDLNIRAERGSPLGLSDRQTGRVMEVIVRGSGHLTAVSIYHHTTRMGPIVGATFGDLLRDEVNALLAVLVNVAACR
jgi:hypothetical protein